MKIKNEYEFKEWFRKNYKQLDFSKIVKADTGEYPDFVMLRNNKEVRVELETLASNFELHGHSLDKVDEIYCLVNDADLRIPTIEVKGLEFEGKFRISATVDTETVGILKDLVRKKKYRNSSHAIETAIGFLKKISEKEDEK